MSETVDLQAQRLAATGALSAADARREMGVAADALKDEAETFDEAVARGVRCMEAYASIGRRVGTRHGDMVAEIASAVADILCATPAPEPSLPREDR